MKTASGFKMEGNYDSPTDGENREGGASEADSSHASLDEEVK